MVAEEMGQGRQRRRRRRRGSVLARAAGGRPAAPDAVCAPFLPSDRGAAAADAAAAKAIRDDVTAGVIGYLQLEVQLDDLYE